MVVFEFLVRESSYFSGGNVRRKWRASLERLWGGHDDSKDESKDESKDKSKDESKDGSEDGSETSVLQYGSVRICQTYY